MIDQDSQAQTFDLDEYEIHEVEHPVEPDASGGICDAFDPDEG